MLEINQGPNFIYKISLSFSLSLSCSFPFNIIIIIIEKILTKYKVFFNLNTKRKRGR